MTNEELCMLIKQGDNGYLPQLWEQTRKFITVEAKSYYKGCPHNNGFEIEDLVQSGYFALLKAVEYYEPEKGYKYLTFLGFTLKNAFREALGIRSLKRDALNVAYSLDATINEEGDITLLDRIGDLTPDTGDVQAEVIESVYHQELHRALDNAMSILPEGKQEIIKLHYYFGLNYKRLARKRGVSHSRICDDLFNSFLRIRKSRHGKILKSFIYPEDINLYKGTSYKAWKNNGTSSVEHTAIKEVGKFGKVSNGHSDTL